jgi:hypothetical protein
MEQISLDFLTALGMTATGMLLLAPHLFPTLRRLGRERLDPEAWRRLEGRRPLALMGVGIGLLWLVQLVLLNP